MSYDVTGIYAGMSDALYIDVDSIIGTFTATLTDDSTGTVIGTVTMYPTLFPTSEVLSFTALSSSATLTIGGISFGSTELKLMGIEVPRDSTQILNVVSTICSEGRYEYGYNGQLKVNEIAGFGNHNTALHGELDTRAGRRWNLDPKPEVALSQYSMFGNSPIRNSDVLLDSPGANQPWYGPMVYMLEKLGKSLDNRHRPTDAKVATIGVTMSILSQVAMQMTPGVNEPVESETGSVAGTVETEIVNVAANGAVKAEAKVENGMFSIYNWTGYPAGKVKPAGPFRLLEGAEYTEARNIANSTNAAIRRTNAEALKELQIHEIHPVKFGGSPVDPANKIFLTQPEHAELTNFWNHLMRDIYKLK